MRRLGAVAVVGAGFLALALGLSNRGGAAVAGSTVSGKVKFVGKAPANPAIDMSEEPKCKAKYTTTPHEAIVEVNKNGTLANAFVYVKSGLPADAKYPVPATPVVIDQSGCMYHPRVLGIMVGQKLDIKNSDPLLHNIKALGKKNRPFNISQPTAGMTTTRTFTATEVMLPFECNVHGWMHAFAAVLPHPFYASTGADGSFSITGLPAGTYTIEAWHERYGAQTATVTVTGSDTKTADFTFTAK
jgi:plastocyanin